MAPPSGPSRNVRCASERSIRRKGVEEQIPRSARDDSEGNCAPRHYLVTICSGGCMRNGFPLATLALTLGCATARQSTSLGAAGGGWLDATVTLDPATTPVYEGDAPMRFEFLKE